MSVNLRNGFFIFLYLILVNGGVIMARSYEAAAAEYKKLAWKLDKQMYRLEKANKKSQYKGVLKYAYKKMVTEIQNWSKGNKRWGQKLPGGKDDADKLKNLEKKIAVMKQLEKLPSFSLKKIKNIYQKAANTINHSGKYGDYQFTWQDLANYYGSSTASVMDALYGSDTELIAYGKVKKMSNKQKNSLKQEIAHNPSKRLDDDLAVSAAIKTLLENL